MGLNVVPTDIFLNIGQVFTLLWPLVALALGIAGAGIVIRIVKGTLGGKSPRRPVMDWEEFKARYKPFMKFSVVGRSTRPSMRKGLPRKGVYRKRRLAGSVLRK